MKTIQYYNNNSQEFYNKTINKESEPFIKPLTKTLSLLKIHSVFEPMDKMKSFKKNHFENTQVFDHCLVIYFKDFSIEKNLEDILNALKDPQAVTLISLSKDYFEESRDNILNLCLDIFNNYHVSLLKIFERLFSHVSFEPWISDFQQYQKQLMEGHPSLTYISDIIKQSPLSLPVSIQSSKKSYKIFLGTLISLGGFYFLFSSFNKERAEQISPVGQMKAVSMIQSNLSLPHESVLLNRSDVLEQMSDKLESNQALQTVALVGIGGSGKTTLARHYAHTHKANVIWEINAETLTCLSNSFEGLAYALAQTEEEKKDLKELQEIKDVKGKEKQIIQFVKQRLKSQPNWLLIYDNVEKFSDLQTYFPTAAWGFGKVILTTRDHNIRNNTHVAHIIPIGELNEQEKLKLFQSIINHPDTQSFNYEQNLHFLKKIPPFPLDISTAAFYIKMTNISQEKYLNYLEKFDNDFNRMQENFLKEMSEYYQTRYNIIKLSLDQIIQEHPDFKDLLLFISLLDSQNIPKNLLESYKSEILVHKFIFALKKYSLITTQSDKNLNLTLSVHRSIQRLILLYMKENIETGEFYNKIQSIVHLFEEYIIKVLEDEKITFMSTLMSHAQTLLNDQSPLTQDMKNEIRGELGGIYCYLGFYLEAQDLLESVMKNFDTSMPQNHAKRARILYYLGSTYGEIGKNSKAVDILTECLTLYQKYFPQNYQRIAQVQAHLGNIYGRIDAPKAIHLLYQSLSLYKTHLSHDYTNIAWNLLFLGYIEESQGHYQAAQKWSEQSLHVCEQHLSNNPLKKAWALASLGIIHTQWGEYTKARTLLKQSLKICEENLPKHHKGLAVVHISLGALECLSQNFHESEKSLNYATIAFEKIYAKDTIAYARLQGEKGILERDCGHYDQALQLFQQSLKIYEISYEENHLRIANLWRELGYTYLLKKDLIKAELYLQKSLKELKAHQHDRIYLTYEYLADLYLQKSYQAKRSNHLRQARNDHHQAVTYFDQALAILISFPKDSPHISRIENKRKAVLL